jgi:transcriptional regulator
MPRPANTPLLQGTLDLLVLKALALQPLHGLGVARRVEQLTREEFQVKPGSLFPALHRMEAAGWIEGSWGESENKRRARYYKLTRAGRRQLDHEAAEWQRVATAMAAALQAG